MCYAHDIASYAPRVGERTSGLAALARPHDEEHLLHELGCRLLDRIGPGVEVRVTERTEGDIRMAPDEPVGAWPRTWSDRHPVVLVVDDEEDFLELTELFLEGDGVRILKARGACEALWHALRSSPDLIFLDLKLPGANGFDILRALKSEPETASIPVFACSGAIDDGEQVLAAGFDAHFTKPVNWPRLRQLVHHLLETRTMQ